MDGNVVREWHTQMFLDQIEEVLKKGLFKSIWNRWACMRNLMKVHTHITLTLYLRRGRRGISDIPLRHPFYLTYLARRNTANVQVISPSQSISGVSAINLLVAFYDIHERKREVLFRYFVPDTTRDRQDESRRYARCV
jgi:hypothetical protein